VILCDAETNSDAAVECIGVLGDVKGGLQS